MLFTEEQEPSRILFLLEGSVKLSLNSVAGGQLIVRIAGPGEILGLSSAVSGFLYDVKAETRFTCMIAPVPRQSFLDFLRRYPVACLNVARQLSLDHKRAYDQLHMLGLTSCTTRKLARRMIEWCADGESDGSDAWFHCSLAYEEIGEHIGASRETVTRALIDLKNQGVGASF